MREARGIAGSVRPEVDGVFLCRGEWEADWFVQLNNTGGPVDVWAVDGIAYDELVETPNGHCYVARTIAPEQLTLVRQDLSAGPPRW